MLRDKIVFTVTGRLQELLLREDSLTLDKVMKICRAFEQSIWQVKEFRESVSLSSSPTQVNKVTQGCGTRIPSGRKPSQPNKTPSKRNERLKFDCKYCGYKHEKQRDKCPAWGKVCEKCKGLNHFKSICKKVHAVTQSHDDEKSYDDQWLMAIRNREDSITATLVVNELDVKFQLDSAADVNTICQKHVRHHQVSPTTVRLTITKLT